MSVQRRVLVLGGIRSGKSELAEGLLAGSDAVRYVATATVDSTDPDWQQRVRAHADRRPDTWATEETGDDPSRLAGILGSAKSHESVIVDDLGGWVTALLDGAGAWAGPAAAGTLPPGAVADLVAAVSGTAAETAVLVSPEVGLTLVAATPAGRIFTDAIGVVNRAVAGVCAEVILVVAGQPVWLKGQPPAGTSATGTAAASAGPVVPVAVTPTAPLRPGGPATTHTGDPTTHTGDPTTHTGDPTTHTGDPTSHAGGPATTLPPIDAAERAATAPTGEALADDDADLAPAIPADLDLPLPDEAAAEAARERLRSLDFAGSGLGALTAVIAFAAAAQRAAVPQPWRSPRALLVHGDHGGGAGAGDPPASGRRRLAETTRGDGALALLAADARAAVTAVSCEAAAPIEIADACDGQAIDRALRRGWRLAERAVDSGADVLVLASLGAGAEAAAVAVISLLTGGEVSAVLGRVVGPDGRIDDGAWMARCAAIRDAHRRVRTRARDPREVLTTLGGADLAVATGVLLGAVSRRTPVLIDGPVGAAAALLARDSAAQSRHWLVLPDDGAHPAVRLAANTLGLTPLFDLRLGLGEGAASLAALPMLRTAVTLAGVTMPRSGQPAADPAPALPAEQ
jgi:adenosyl cobinamide kinase/adenosyl cobinamide phosphate guanylyltransferase/NaMN:DMB phosphoribosyltransferase